MHSQPRKKPCCIVETQQTACARLARPLLERANQCETGPMLLNMKMHLPETIGAESQVQSRSVLFVSH